MAPLVTTDRARAAVAAALLAIAVVAYWTLRPGVTPKPAAGALQAVAHNAASREPGGVDLSDSQLAAVKVEPVEEREFPVEKDAVGSIGFNEDMTVQVFTPYQGRIVALFAEVGDDVSKGQTLFTIDSPDLLQAESTLIAAAGVLELNSKNLARLRDLFTTRAVSQHDVEQATSDQQTAEGNLRAARDAVRLFGKTDADIDIIIAKRSADPTLVVPSPITGRITARHGAPGLYVQPGNEPAPFTIADINTMWMLANVIETDSPAFRVGQEARVKVTALPGRMFDGKITTVAASVDPNTRRVLVRSEVKDPQHELRSGMFADFVISVGAPVRSPAIPLDGVVREGDGTMTAWVTADRRHFTQHTVTIGQERDGYRQILDGVQVGELVATEGALFLSNTLATASR
jgi:cobalt-zinc-cadmium efflux system membrane fusion protein